jgi:hypothetical protein
MMRIMNFEAVLVVVEGSGLSGRRWSIAWGVWGRGGRSAIAAVLPCWGWNLKCSVCLTPPSPRGLAPAASGKVRAQASRRF